MNDKSKFVYETRALFEDIYVTEVKDRGDFSNKYNFHIFKIVDFHFYKEHSELVLELRKSNGSNLPYPIVGESEIKQFMANPIKKVEVFICDDNIKGICPIYEFEQKKENVLSYGDNPKDWNLEDCVGDDFDK